MTHRLARFVALALLAWQAVVVQAHGHGSRPVAPAGVSISASSARATDNPVDCAVCRVVAQAGQYLSPGATVFASPATQPAWRAPLLRAATSLPSLSHAWRSRAPPVPLPA